MAERLYKELIEYSKGNTVPFHMPGHKRNLSELFECLNVEFLKDAYAVDITEIDGFDNLHDAKGLISEAEKNAAKLYGAEETHFLVNGSSCGVLASIFAVADKGSKIIVARNCHKSVYNAIYLNELEPVFIYPEVDYKEGIATSIYPKEVEKAILNNPDAKAVIITSPTYDGVISDVCEISRVAHEFDIPLIVDEAHGALFYIEGRSAVQNNADIVINSVHKTLPALTGTALIHINGQIVDREKIRKYLTIFQTSSPSYVLMGSIDYAMDIMEKSGRTLYQKHCMRILRLKESLQNLENIKLYSRNDSLINGAFDFDESKVLLCIKDDKTSLSGKQLGDILLKDYLIQAEMVTEKYVLLMLTVMDKDEFITALIDGLKDIDNNISAGKYDDTIKAERSKENINNSLKNKLLEKSDRTVFVYPPGIPIVFEGEIITEEVISKIDKALIAGLDVKGL